MPAERMIGVTMSPTRSPNCSTRPLTPARITVLSDSTLAWASSAWALAFHTAVLDHIPVMDYERRNEVKRFIILIDTLYDNLVKLVASAAAEPDALYRADEGFESYEFKRTASRLIEMRSEAYLALPHGHGHTVVVGSTAGIVET
jgi:cell division protein ZapE